MDWNIAHGAFVAYADEVLPDAPPPVGVLGIDETRRGKGRYEIVTSTGVKVASSHAMTSGAISNIRSDLRFCLELSKVDGPL